MSAVIHCPLCEWVHEDPGPNPRATNPMALASVFGPGVFAAHAINEHAREVELVLREHLQTHKLEEWVLRVTLLNNQVRMLEDAALERGSQSITDSIDSPQPPL